MSQTDATFTTTPIYDTTTLDLFALCPRKFWYANQNNLQPLEESAPLSYGTAIHEGLYHYYKGEKIEDCLIAFALTLKENNRSVIPVTIAEAEEEGSKYSIEYGAYVLTQYFSTWPRKDDYIKPLKDANGEPYLEVGFAADVGSGILVGKIDGIFYEVENPDNLWLVEHKHTQRILNSSWYEKYHLSNQITNYLWAAQELLGRPLQGAIINGIRVHLFKRGTLEEQNEKRFLRITSHRSPAQLQRRKAELNFQFQIVEEFKKHGKDAFYMNAPNACYQFGTGLATSCPFIPLCLSREESVLSRFTEYGYVQHEWSPYDISESLKEERPKRIVEI